MNLMGTVWMPSVGMIQFVAVVGVYGLSFVTVLAAAAPAALMTPLADEHRGRRPWLLPAVAFGAACGGLGRRAGPLRAGTRSGADRSEPPPGSGQHRSITEVGGRSSRGGACAPRPCFRTSRGFDETDVVIWPETAVPFFMDESTTLQSFVSRAAPPGGYVITGAPRRTRSAGRTIAVWNSLHALGPAEAITASYDKHHLVPFGEYMPLRGIINLRAIAAAGTVDSSPGPGAAHAQSAGCAALQPADLLRGDLSRRGGGRGRAAGRTAAMAAQHHQRRLVRAHRRALSTFSGGAPSGRGGGHAAGAGGEHRNFPPSSIPTDAWLDASGWEKSASSMRHSRQRLLRRLRWPG